MKTDLYTKIILTVIAVALTFNVVKELNIVPTANAGNDAMSVSNIMAPQREGVIDVRVVERVDVNIDRISTSSNIPVDVKNNVKIDAPYGGLDVNVKNGIKMELPYGGLDVNVKNYRDFK